jgi:hypothetical protein
MGVHSFRTSGQIARVAKGGIMAAWRGTALSVLEANDEEACLSFIRAGSSGGPGRVKLIEGELTAIEALQYARVLLELDREAEAREIVDAVIASEIAAARGGYTSRIDLQAVA